MDKQSLAFFMDISEKLGRIEGGMEEITRNQMALKDIQEESRTKWDNYRDEITHKIEESDLRVRKSFQGLLDFNNGCPRAEVKKISKDLEVILFFSKYKKLAITFIIMAFIIFFSYLYSYFTIKAEIREFRGEGFLKSSSKVTKELTDKIIK